MKINKRVYQYIKWGIIGAFVIVAGIIGIVGLSHIGDEKAPELSTAIPQPQQINTPPPSHQQEVISNVSDPLIDAMAPLINMFPMIIAIIVIMIITFLVWNMFRGQYD